MSATDVVKLLARRKSAVLGSKSAKRAYCIIGVRKVYGTENTIPYFRTVLFVKIPYVIPYRTFFQNLIVP